MDTTVKALHVYFLIIYIPYYVSIRLTLVLLAVVEIKFVGVALIFFLSITISQD